MFEDFENGSLDTGEAEIHYRRGGDGPPILLLHGHPQTHVMWHRVAPRLAEDFTVVATDLRGYGDSSKPVTAPDHEPASKRAMARDQVEVMRQLGFERFSVAGHDRGGRVAYRMALDHPDHVERLAVLDIIPTGEVWRRFDAAWAFRYWHWLFLAQPEPLPERWIGLDPEAYYFRGDRSIFAPEALAEYLHHVHEPDHVHAMCEDYRAGATIDRQHDDQDRSAGKRISCPVLALWSEREELNELCDVLEVWREWADDVRGRALDSGHYLAEEQPDEVASELTSFFRDAT
jgi:haloacetate dehalogenase